MEKKKKKKQKKFIRQGIQRPKIHIPKKIVEIMRRELLNAKEVP